MRPVPHPVGGGEAGAAADRELRRAQYHRDPGPLQRVLTWLARRIGDLLGGGTGGSHALLLLLLLLAVLGIVLVVRAGAPRRARRSGGTGDADPLAPAAAVDHRRIALQLTAQGRHAEALREWLRAAVATIEHRGVLAPLPGRTGAATAREAGPLLPAAADGLATATRAFDEVWFGGRPATAADVHSARSAADAVAAAPIAVPR